MSSRRQRRHRAQAGTTLIELLVCTVIIGLALLLLVGAFSTGLIDSTLVKRNTSVDAAVSYELEKIGAAAFVKPSYSECFAVDSPGAPREVAFGGTCAGGPADLRADVRVGPPEDSTIPAGVQQWTVQLVTYPGLIPVGSPVSVYKANR
jgi:hypothetical protein